MSLGLRSPITNKNLVKSTTRKQILCLHKAMGAGLQVLMWYTVPPAGAASTNRSLTCDVMCGNARKEYASPLTATDFGLSLVLLSCVLLLLLLRHCYY